MATESSATVLQTSATVSTNHASHEARRALRSSERSGRDVTTAWSGRSSAAWSQATPSVV
ncbi:MAG: hypothetical protein KC776_17590 [Myxococcales bacterium]|nr:hypothetical protein [Myxococcales bacterium]MCB9581590.1 hypothetical protein [Polyangiaceae bacterium]